MIRITSDKHALTIVTFISL